MSEGTETVLPEVALSEQEFLKHQAEQARLAISQALANARAGLAEGVDPREWTKKFPIIAISSAALAGFMTAVMTIPSKDDQRLGKLQKIKEALEPTPPPPAASPATPGTNGKAAAAQEHHSLWVTLAKEAVQLIRPVLTSLLFSGFSNFAGQAPAPQPDYGTDPTRPDVHDNPRPA